MPTLTWSNFQWLAKQKPLQKGWKPLINALITQNDDCRGHRLSAIWVGCQRADCQRPRKSGTIRKCMIYGTLYKMKPLQCLVGVNPFERYNPLSRVFPSACSRTCWHVSVWQIILPWCLQHHFPSLCSAQMFELAQSCTRMHAHTHTHTPCEAFRAQPRSSCSSS